MNSDIKELRRKVEDDTASKEDIAMLAQKIDELNTVQERHDAQLKHPGNSLTLIGNYNRIGTEIENLALLTIFLQWKNVKIGTEYVLIDLVGPDEKIFGSRPWHRCAITGSQIFSRPAIPNSVNTVASGNFATRRVFILFREVI